MSTRLSENVGALPKSANANGVTAFTVAADELCYAPIRETTTPRATSSETPCLDCELATVVEYPDALAVRNATFFGVLRMNSQRRLALHTPLRPPWARCSAATRRPVDRAETRSTPDGIPA